MIQNMKPNEDMSDGSQRLLCYTAPAPVLEELVPVHGSELLTQKMYPFILIDQTLEA
jgi:hypothetical protein